MKNFKNTWVFVLLVVVSITLLLPLFYVLVMSFSTTETFPTSLDQLTIENYQKVLEQYDFLRMNINSMLIASSTIILSLTFASMAAFALSKINFKWNHIVIGMFFAGLFMPGQVLIVPVYQMIVNLNLIDTRFGLVMYYVGSSMPFAIFLMMANIKSMPKPLIESAFLDGASWFTIYRRIAVPYLKPTIFTLAIMNFMGYWNELFYAMIILQDPDKRTVTVEMASLSQKFGNDIPILYAGLILGSIPIIIFYFVFQKRIGKGQNEGAVK